MALDAAMYSAIFQPIELAEAARHRADVCRTRPRKAGALFAVPAAVKEAVSILAPSELLHGESTVEAITILAPRGADARGAHLVDSVLPRRRPLGSHPAASGSRALVMNRAVGRG